MNVTFLLCSLVEDDQLTYNQLCLALYRAWGLKVYQLTNHIYKLVHVVRLAKYIVFIFVTLGHGAQQLDEGLRE